jgi:transaldolase
MIALPFPSKKKTEMNSWISNAYIKYPRTAEGLKAAQRSVAEGIRVNITLCFSQQQAAAIYAATKGSRAPVYVSPFVGRLDDIGQNGVDLVRNIKRMFDRSDHHVLVLAASIRDVQHLLYPFHLHSELVTVPARILEQWAKQGMPLRMTTCLKLPTELNLGAAVGAVQH